MRIAQLLSGIDISITNEESNFIKKFPTNVSLASLTEHDHWIAQNLVRKGVYSISKDSNTISKNLHEKN